MVALTDCRWNEVVPIPADQLRAGRAPSPSLLLTRPFGWLWTGQAISEVGSGVSALAMPLLALTLLGASAVQVALLPTLAGAAVLVAAPIGGLLTDRLNHRQLLLACDGARLLLVLSVPVTAAAGALTMVHLYLVSAAIAALTVIFGIAHHSFFPRLVPARQLTAANSRMATTESLARVAGPAIGGALVAAAGASRALLVDVATFGASLLCVWRIRSTPHPTPTEPLERSATIASTLWDGFTIIRRDAVLARLVASTIVGMGALAMSGAVTVLFFTRDLHLSAGAVGVTFATAEVAGVGAALLTPVLAQHLGSARLLLLTGAAAPAGYLVLLAEPGPSALVTAAPAAVFMAAWAARFVTIDVLQYTYRQRICPPTHLGRLNACVRTMLGLATTLGALAGGACAQTMGARASLVLATTLMCLAPLPLLASPLWRRRELLDSHSDSESLRCNSSTSNLQPATAAEPTTPPTGGRLPCL